MAGVEIFAVAVSVLQVADLGARVSAKLFGFARRIKGAAERIDAISKDIAATGALLQQLGGQLEKDNQRHLIRTEVLDRANEVVEEIRKIFQSIDKAVDGNSGSKIILSLKQKIWYTSIESEIDALRLKLENLKSSIGIMQNVLIYAEQLRNRDQFHQLEEQQDLLRTLGQEKLANERHYKDLLNAIKERPQDRDPKTTDAEPGSHVALESRDGTFLDNANPGDARLCRSDILQQMTLNDREVREYSSLVAHLLGTIHSRRYNLCQTVRDKIQIGVLELHWEHWAPFRRYHDDRVLLALFKDVQELVRFWTHRIKLEGTQEADELRSPPLRTPKDIMMARTEKLRKAEKLREANNFECDESAPEPRRPLYNALTYSWKPVHTRDGRCMTQFKLMDVSTRTLDSFGLAWEFDKKESGCVLVLDRFSPALVEDLVRDTRERYRALPGALAALAAARGYGQIDLGRVRRRSRDRSSERSPHRAGAGVPLPSTVSYAGRFERARNKSRERSRSRSSIRNGSRSWIVGGIESVIAVKDEQDAAARRDEAPMAKRTRTESTTPNADDGGLDARQPISPAILDSVLDSEPDSAVDVDALLSQWTTLSIQEIARGKEPSQYSRSLAESLTI